MQEQEKAHAASGIEVSQLVLVAQGNAFDGLTLHGPFTDAEWAGDWATHKLRNEEWHIVFVTPLEDELSESLSEPNNLSDLPEGLYAETTAASMVVYDAQDWPWVTVDSGSEGDPDKWGAAIRRRVLTALGLPYSAKLFTFVVHTSLGERTWQAEDEQHAREQHQDAFSDEPIIWVRKLIR